MKLHPGSLVLLVTVALRGLPSTASAAELPPLVKEQKARVVQTMAAYLLASAEQEGALRPELAVKALEANTKFLRYQLESLTGAKTHQLQYERAFDFVKHVSVRTKDNSTSIRDALALLMKTQLVAGVSGQDFWFAVMDAVAKRTGISDLAPPTADQQWAFENATHEPDADDVRYAAFRLCSALATVADAVDGFVQAHESDIARFADEAESDFAGYKKRG